VFTDGTKLATWTFDKPIASLTDASGMLIPDGGAITLVAGTATFTVSVLYENVVDEGLSWTCDASQVAITFADGSTLQDGSGVTIGPTPP
jgi:hypothetical protein